MHTTIKHHSFAWISRAETSDWAGYHLFRDIRMTTMAAQLAAENPVSRTWHVTALSAYRVSTAHGPGQAGQPALVLAHPDETLTSTAPTPTQEPAHPGHRGPFLTVA